jgi:hypothetical protein
MLKACRNGVEAKLARPFNPHGLTMIVDQRLVSSAAHAHLKEEIL